MQDMNGKRKNFFPFALKAAAITVSHNAWLTFEKNIDEVML